MKNEIKEIKDGKVWNSFVSNQDFVNVLSSWEWQEFEKQNGFEVFSYGIYLDSKLNGVFSFTFVESRRGKYMLLRHSAFLDWNDRVLVNEVLIFLKDFCRERGVSFMRLSPTLLYSSGNEDLFLNYGFKKAVIKSNDAQFTTVLDLTKDLESFLFNMRKNTRYLIRKGEKMGIKIRNIGDEKSLEDFENVYTETVSRHNWNAFDFDYIKKQFLMFSEKNVSRMFLAEYEGDILAAAIFTKFGNQVIYHHSGSVSRDSVPANYVLLWEAIKYYKDFGLKEFNFFGISKDKSKNDSWYGITLFKKGFGGFDRELVGNFDYPVNSRYFITRILESLKQKFGF